VVDAAEAIGKAGRLPASGSTKDAAHGRAASGFYSFGLDSLTVLLSVATVAVGWGRPFSPSGARIEARACYELKIQVIENRQVERISQNFHLGCKPLNQKWLRKVHNRL